MEDRTPSGAPAAARPPSERFCRPRWEYPTSSYPHRAASVSPLPAPEAESSVPEDIRFQILYRLFFRSASKSSMDCPSTPAAPLFALTRLYASQTSRFEYLKRLDLRDSTCSLVSSRDHARLLARPSHG